MAQMVPLHSITQGALGEREDSWRLIVADDGAMHVEHEWSYLDAYGNAGPNSGRADFSVDDFLAGHHDLTAKDKLRAVLKDAQQNEAS